MLANVNVSAKETYEKVLDFIRNQKSSLPTLPVVINNIIVTAKSDKTSAYDLADFIINDQAISTRILKIANSALYARQREIISLWSLFHGILPDCSFLLLCKAQSENSVFHCRI